MKENMMKMRLFTVLLTLGSLISAQAADQSLSDLMYKSDKGKLDYSATFGYETGETGFLYPNSTSGAGVWTNLNVAIETETTVMRLNQSINYGLTSNFELGLNINYLIKNEEKRTAYKELNVPFIAGPAGGDTFNGDALDNKGLEDPTLTVNYRFLKKESLLFDFYGVLSPSLMDAERRSLTLENSADTAYLNEEGNAARGGHKIAIGAEIGAKKGNFQWSTDLALAYNLEGERTILKGDNINNVDQDYIETVEAFMEINLQTNAQFALTNKLSAGLGLGLKITPERDETFSLYYGSTTISESHVVTLASHLDYEVAANLKYLMSSNFLGHLSLAYNVVGDHTREQAETTVATNTLNATYHQEFVDQSAVKIAFGVDYAF